MDTGGRAKTMATGRDTGTARWDLAKFRTFQQGLRRSQVPGPDRRCHAVLRVAVAVAAVLAS